MTSGVITASVPGAPVFIAPSGDTPLVWFEVAIKGGVTLLLGDTTQVAEKLAAAEAVLVSQHARGTVIDVRVPRSPAVTHK